MTKKSRIPFADRNPSKLNYGRMICKILDKDSHIITGKFLGRGWYSNLEHLHDRALNPSLLLFFSETILFPSIMLIQEAICLASRAK